MITIRSVFDAAEQPLKFVADRALIERLVKYERDFVNRNEDHIEFFGGMLVGVHPMRFRQQDREDWFLDIVPLDELDLEENMSKVESLDADWVRANDVMNLSCVWLMHKLFISPKLTQREKEQGLVLVAQILQYKFLGSILSRYFRYTADKATMEATIASLSRKYAIKTAGSWWKLLHARAEEIASSRSIHRKAYAEFTQDNAIVYMISDIQGRLRELIKNIWAQFAKMRESGAKIITERTVLTFDGETIVKDKSKKFSSYLRYIHDVAGDRHNFIREELMEVVCSIMPSMPPRHLKEALEWMSLNHRVKGAECVEQLIDETLLHCFSLISSQRALYGGTHALEPLLSKLRALYMASRMSDPALLSMKQLAEEIVKQSVKSKNASVQAGVRTSIQLYIVLRTLAMKYYQS